VLAFSLIVLFHRSFLPGDILFSNDGPLGRQVSECHRLPDAFTGVWQDLEGVGYREGGAVPSITSGLRLVLGPVGYSKFYGPLALLLLGMCAWCFFRRMGLSPVASVLGGLAAGLNSSYFSAACWGVAAHPITVGMAFLALAALANNSSEGNWLRTALAGFAVGLVVTEGYDIGVLFSVCVAAFMLYQALTSPGEFVKRASLGFGQIGRASCRERV